MIIFMLGIGGEAYRETHFADTVYTLQQMPLGRGDLVYLSPFVADEPSPYLETIHAAGIASLDAETLAAGQTKGPTRDWIGHQQFDALGDSPAGVLGLGDHQIVPDLAAPLIIGSIVAERVLVLVAQRLCPVGASLHPKKRSAEPLF